MSVMGFHSNCCSLYLLLSVLFARCCGYQPELQTALNEDTQNHGDEAASVLHEKSQILKRLNDRDFFALGGGGRISPDGQQSAAILPRYRDLNENQINSLVEQQQQQQQADANIMLSTGLKRPPIGSRNKRVNPLLQRLIRHDGMGKSYFFPINDAKSIFQKAGSPSEELEDKFAMFGKLFNSRFGAEYLNARRVLRSKVAQKQSGFKEKWNLGRNREEEEPNERTLLLQMVLDEIKQETDRCASSYHPSSQEDFELTEREAGRGAGEKTYLEAPPRHSHPRPETGGKRWDLPEEEFLGSQDSSTSLDDLCGHKEQGADMPFPEAPYLMIPPQLHIMPRCSYMTGPNLLRKQHGETRAIVHSKRLEPAESTPATP